MKTIMKIKNKDGTNIEQIKRDEWGFSIRPVASNVVFIDIDEITVTIRKRGTNDIGITVPEGYEIVSNPTYVKQFGKHCGEYIIRKVSKK